MIMIGEKGVEKRYKNWIRNDVLETDRYKIIIGRHWTTLWAKSYIGYIKVNGKFKFITAYQVSVIDNLNLFLSQLEYHFRESNYIGKDYLKF